MARLRAVIIQGIRSFFVTREYLEVDTPALAPVLLPESHIEPFATQTVHPYAASQRLYLLPSPELWMKRLVARGYGNIFQIGKCYRNAEQLGRLHNPEFTMLEWYTVRADDTASADLTELVLAFTADLVEGAAQRIAADAAGRSPAADEAARALRSASARCRPPALRVRMGELCAEHAGLTEDDFGCHERIRAVARDLGMETPPNEEPADTFQRIFLTHVEPMIPTDRPVIVTDYPELVTAFAESAVDRPVRRRWELYLGGIEVANCYTELRDVAELRRLFGRERKRRKDALVPVEVDRELPEEFALAPPCSGVALGVDRLIMALTGVAEIQGVIFFPNFGMVP